MKLKILRVPIALIMLFAGIGSSASASDPWRPNEVIQPEVLALTLKLKEKKPFLIHVGFQVLYKNGHIPGSVYAGPTNTPAGIASLRKAVDPLARDYPIVIYCGCCPLGKCPNVRPAFKALRDMGFKNVSLLNLTDDLNKNWIAKGFPNER